jgi:hypothetical protein
MASYLIIRLMTLRDYDDLNDVNLNTSYSFLNIEEGIITINKLLIQDAISLTHDNFTICLDLSEGIQTTYKEFHGDYVAGLETDRGEGPIKERSWIVFGKKI